MCVKLSPKKNEQQGELRVRSVPTPIYPVLDLVQPQKVQPRQARLLRYHLVED
jgi:hypothetical protein